MNYRMMRLLVSEGRLGMVARGCPSGLKVVFPESEKGAVPVTSATIPAAETRLTPLQIDMNCDDRISCARVI
jgi:hypothetical protein